MIELSSLRELITEKPIRGWGEDPKKVEAVIKDDPECLAFYREAMKEQGRRTDLGDNITEVKPQEKGTSKAYTCERLSKVAPEKLSAIMRNTAGQDGLSTKPVKLIGTSGRLN